MSATNAQVIAAIKTILAAQTALALTSYIQPGEIDSPASIGVVDGDRIRGAKDLRYTGVLVDVSVFVPIDEAAADLAAEKATRQASAQTIFTAVKDAIESTVTPWRQAVMESSPSYGLVRPQPHVLAAGASAPFLIAV